MRTSNPARAGFFIVLLAIGLSTAPNAQIGNTPGSGFTTIIGSAMRYVMAYEEKFSLLVAEETYVQELQRPPNPGDNLTQRNPGQLTAEAAKHNVGNVARTINIPTLAPWSRPTSTPPIPRFAAPSPSPTGETRRSTSGCRR